IGLVLQPVNFDYPALHLARLDLLNARKGEVNLLYRLHHYVRKPPHGLGRRPDLVQVQTVSDCLDVVENIIVEGGEFADVLSVNRSDESLDPLAPDGMIDVVHLTLNG